MLAMIRNTPVEVIQQIFGQPVQPFIFRYTIECSRPYALVHILSAGPFFTFKTIIMTFGYTAVLYFAPALLVTAPRAVIFTAAQCAYQSANAVAPFNCVVCHKSTSFYIFLFYRGNYDSIMS